MGKRFVAVVLVLGLAGASGAAVFSDNFDTPHNYLTEGVGAYAGTLGTMEALDASTSRPGALYMQSSNSAWDGVTQGPLLYTTWTGDFIATVKVTDFAGTPAVPAGNNAAGILARDPASAGGTENWVSIDYFPRWTAFIAWQGIGGNRPEAGQVVGSWTGADTYAIAAQYPWLQLSRKGNDFSFKISSDGVNFIPLTDPAYQGIYNGTQNALVISRPDLPATLQIGLHQMTYDPASGYAAFDNFKIVPEPATLALLGLGGLALLRRKHA